MRRVWRMAAIAAVCGAAWVGRTAPAGAAPEVQLDDRAGVLDAAGEARVLAAIDRLRDEDGVRLYVVYVRSFGGAPPEDWAERAAVADDLGVEDVLLAVAVDDLQYGYSVGATVPVDDERLARIAVRELVPTMSDRAWADAAVALADAYRAEIGRGRKDLPPWVVAAFLVLLVGAGGAGARARAWRRRGDAPGLTSDP
jgi:uncharacterized membrane protein YgcG